MDNSRGATASDAGAGDVNVSRGRGCGPWIVLLLVLLAGGGATAYVGGAFALRQEQPIEPEAGIADLAKRWLAVEPGFTDWKMPPRAREPQSIAAGKELYNVQCAMCHGNNGKGDSPLGQTMFPPAADLTRDRTQNKTDGQLFWLIAHGLNYTGMPAWGVEYGGSNSQDEIWNMVAYIRTLRGQ